MSSLMHSYEELSRKSVEKLADTTSTLVVCFGNLAFFVLNFIV